MKKIAMILVILASHAHAAPAKLLCVAEVHGQRLSQVLTINYDKHTVDGIGAKFTENEITFVTGGNNIVTQAPELTEHHLNRLDGTYWAGVEGALYPEPPPRYACKVAPAQQF